MTPSLDKKERDMMRRGRDKARTLAVWNPRPTPEGPAQPEPTRADRGAAELRDRLGRNLKRR